MKKWLARSFLNQTGWTPRGAKPEIDKYVFIAAPHTSNWDFLFMLAFAAVFDIHISWIGKQALFRGPLGMFMRRLGGIPVDRDQPQGVVKQIAELFHEREQFRLAVPPEGSRSRQPYWRSGFYFIAKAAGVPIVLSSLDYGRKEGCMGTVLWPTDDVRADMDKIRAFYHGKTGLYPDAVSPVRLKIEDEP